MQKGGLEIVYNLEWKNKLCYGEEKSNMVGIVDDPANALDYVTFKTYLLRNSGSSVGIDHVRVSYTKNGQQFFIDTSVAFERALSTFRRRAKAGKVTTLTLEYVNPVYVTKQCDVHTQVDQDHNNTTPPEWFTTYMLKFKDELIKEISSKFAAKIYKSKAKTKERAAICKMGDKNKGSFVPFTPKDEAKTPPKKMEEAFVAVTPSTYSKGTSSASNSDVDFVNILFPFDRAQKRKLCVETQLTTNTVQNSVSPCEDLDITKDSTQKREVKVEIPSSSTKGDEEIVQLCPSKDDTKETALTRHEKDLIHVLATFDRAQKRKHKKGTQLLSNTLGNDSAYQDFDVTQSLTAIDCIQKNQLKLEIPSASNEPTNQTCGTLDGANILDVDFENCEQLQKKRVYGGENYKFNWNIKNTGAMSWTAKTEVRYAWGSVELKPLNDKIPCPHLKPGETGAICMDVMLPVQPGEYMCHFKFYHEDEVFGKWFGIEVKIDQHTGTNQQCVRSPIYDVITIHGAYELLLPSAWTKFDTYKPVELTLKQTNITDENIMDGAVTSSQLDMRDNTGKDEFISTSGLREAIEESDIKILEDSLKKISNNEITNKINRQVHIVSNIDLQDDVGEDDDKQPQEKNTDSQLLDCEHLEEKAKEDSIINAKDDFCMLSDDDRSIISIPDSISSVHSEPSEEFIHVRLSSPDGDVTNGSTSENENILQQFEEIDEFPKVEIVVPDEQIYFHNDIINHLDDAINDNSEEKQLLLCTSNNDIECNELKTQTLGGEACGNSDKTENASTVTSSFSSDSTTDYAYVVYDGEKIPVSKKYLREDYLVTAEEVPIEFVRNVDTLANHNLLPENSTISDCSCQRLYDSAESSDADSATNIQSDTLASSNAELRKTTEIGSVINMAKIVNDVLTSDNTKDVNPTPYENNDALRIESTKPSICNFDQIGYDHKKRVPDGLRTKSSISNTHIKNDRKKSSHRPLVELGDAIEPICGVSSTDYDLRAKSSKTKQSSDKPVTHCGNNVAKHEASGGHVKPYVSALKRQIMKFRRSMSSSISDAVDMIPDVLEHAKADGYWCDGQRVSLDPSKHEGLALKMLREMGFQNETYNSALLVRYNYDLNKVITELLSYLE